MQSRTNRHYERLNVILVYTAADITISINTFILTVDQINMCNVKGQIFLSGGGGEKNRPIKYCFDLP